MAEREPYSPVDQLIVSDMIQIADSTRNVGIFVETLARISEHYRHLDMLEIEKMLRKQKSNTYLIAVPVDASGDQISVLPHSGDRKYPFRLEVCLGGFTQAAKRLYGDLSVSLSENYDRLPITGLPNPKPGSVLEARMRAEYN